MDTDIGSFTDRLNKMIDSINLINVLDDQEIWLDSSLTSEIIDLAKQLAVENLEEVLSAAKSLKAAGKHSAAIGLLVICGNTASTFEHKMAAANAVPNLVTRLYNVRWVVAANNSLYGLVKPGKNYKRAKLPACLQQGVSSVLMHADDTAILDGRGGASHPTWRDTISTLKNRKVNWPLRSDHLDYLIRGSA